MSQYSTKSSPTPTRSPKIEGGCFCGKIRFQIDGEIRKVLNCHCSMCRRTSGAPFVSWLLVPIKNFSYLSEEPKHLQSSELGERWFCDNCGTPIACIVHSDKAPDKKPKYIDITLGSLDEPGVFVPDGDFHEDTKLKWL